MRNKHIIALMLLTAVSASATTHLISTAAPESEPCEEFVPCPEPVPVVAVTCPEPPAPCPLPRVCPTWTCPEPEITFLGEDDHGHQAGSLRELIDGQVR